MTLWIYDNSALLFYMFMSSCNMRTSLSLLVCSRIWGCRVARVSLCFFHLVGCSSLTQFGFPREKKKHMTSYTKMRDMKRAAKQNWGVQELKETAQESRDCSDAGTNAETYRGESGPQQRHMCTDVRLRKGLQQREQHDMINGRIWYPPPSYIRFAVLQSCSLCMTADSRGMWWPAESHDNCH